MASGMPLGGSVSRFDGFASLTGMKLDLQDQNEVQRRTKACENGKRDPLADLQKANDQAHALGKKFRESAGNKGTFSQSAAENYARALHEVTICEIVLSQFQQREAI